MTLRRSKGITRDILGKIYEYQSGALEVRDSEHVPFLSLRQKDTAKGIRELA